MHTTKVHLQVCFCPSTFWISKNLNLAVLPLDSFRVFMIRSWKPILTLTNSFIIYRVQLLQYKYNKRWYDLHKANIPPHMACLRGVGPSAVLCKTCNVLLCVLEQPRVDNSSLGPLSPGPNWANLT
jgi:hypothetical protein